MPKVRVWTLAILVVFSPLGCATAPPPKPAPLPRPPAQPSAAFLEFIGDWTDAERELMTMNEKPEKSAPTKKPQGDSHAR
jgi:hypothetical protein